MRPLAAAALLVLAGLAAGCKNGQPFILQDAMDGLIGDIDGLLGKSSVPGKYLAAIRDVHDRQSWNFRPDVEAPLEITRNAVRALATCDYSSWAEAALVVEILSSMADEHPSSLVRAEALDTLTRMQPWTESAVVAAERPATSAEMIEGVKVLKAAVGKDDSDPAFTAQVATAVAALATYPFDRVELTTAQAADNKATARAFGTQLRTARGALRSVNGRTLEGFQADAAVHEALDRAYVALSASVIRLSLLKCAIGDSAETTRSAALRDIAAITPAGGAAVLRAVLLRDGVAAVRREAARAFTAYPMPVSVPPLIDALADEMAEVRGAAARALATVSGEDFGDDRAAWLKWWQTTGSKTATAEAGK